MRLDLYAIDGERKWTGISDGRLLSNRLSERSIVTMVKGMLRSHRRIIA